MFSTFTEFLAAVRFKPTPGTVRCAGVAIQAVDTDRVLMIQRALNPEDPAAGEWEFPGGHIEDGEDLRSGAVREWQEEVGVPLPMGGVWGQTWQTGCYTGHIYRVGCEAGVQINQVEGRALNPDDPGHGNHEVACFFHPDSIQSMPDLRQELRGIDWTIFQRSQEELALERLTGRIGKENALAVLARAKQLAAPRATGAAPKKELAVEVEPMPAGQVTAMASLSTEIESPTQPGPEYVLARTGPKGGKYWVRHGDGKQFTAKMYHGGAPDLKQLDTSRGETTQYGPGAYMASGKGTAEQWADERGGVVHNVQANLSAPWDDRDAIPKTPERNKLTAFLTGEGLSPNWLDVAYSGEHDDPFKMIARALGKDEKSFWPGANKLNRFLRKAGYDGVIGKLHDGIQVVAFHPHNVKIGHNP